MFPALIRLVDDDREFRSAQIFALRMAGFDAVGFESAEAFLRDDDVRRPGCVVLDVRMDGMSGLDCLRKLRDAGRDIPVVFLSGHGDIDMALWAVKHGAADFLQNKLRLSADLAAGLHQQAKLPQMAFQTRKFLGNITTVGKDRYLLEHALIIQVKLKPGLPQTLHQQFTII